MLQREIDCIIIGCKDKDIAVIFDGTSKLYNLTDLTHSIFLNFTFYNWLNFLHLTRLRLQINSGEVKKV